MAVAYGRTLVIIAMLVAIGPLSTDMYLPALPTLKTIFNSSVGEIQLTLSYFLFGFAVAQLFCGPLADRYGRKPVILAGMLIYIVASIGCAMSTSATELLIMRVLQAVGACVGPVLGRTIIRDVYGANAASALSYMASIMALAPAIAPVIGGVLLTAFEWTAIFYSLGLFALIVSLFYASLIPETLKEEYRQPLTVAPIFKNFAVLLRDPLYVGYLLCGSIGYAGMFTYISGSPFVLIEYFGVSETKFGFFFLLIVVGYIGGSFMSGRLSAKYDDLVLLKLGCTMVLISGIASLVSPHLGVHSVYMVVLPVVLYAASMGFVLPQAMAGGLKEYPHIAGTASALMGFVQMGFSGCAGILFGIVHQGDEIAMSSIIGLLGLACYSCYRWLILRNLGRQTDGIPT